MQVDYRHQYMVARHRRVACDRFFEILEQARV